MRGNRIQNIVNELQGEKIDVVRWNKDVGIFIAKALSPAEVAHVELGEGEKAATVVVPDRHLSLAIGRDGQNARLAARLTGWRLDIKGATEWEEFVQQRQAEEEARRIAEREAALEAELTGAEKTEEEVVEAVAEEAEVSVAAEEQVLAEEEVEVPVAEETEVPVAAEVETVEVEEEPVPAVSAEEELAALAVEDEEEEEEEEEEEWEEEAEPIDTLSEELWKVPAGVPDAGVIRFAEDILGEGNEPGGGGRKGRRSGRGKASRSRRGRGGRR
jgi:N utilization substance protein A